MLPPCHGAPRIVISFGASFIEMVVVVVVVVTAAAAVVVVTAAVLFSSHDSIFYLDK